MSTQAQFYSVISSRVLQGLTVTAALLAASWAVPCRADNTAGASSPPAATAVATLSHIPDSKRHDTGRAEVGSAKKPARERGGARRGGAGGGVRSAYVDDRERIQSGDLIAILRRLSTAPPEVRHAVVVACCVLMGMFLICVGGMVLLVRSVLRADGKGSRSRPGRRS